MRWLRRIALCAPLVALFSIVIGLPTVAFGDDDNREFRAFFLGVNETPSSVSTEASASLKLHISGSGDAATIDYTLMYANLRADATQAHMHFGQSRTSGPVVVYLCKTTQTDAPLSTPTCAPRTATITGKLTAAEVTGKAATQGIAAGEMARFVRAIREGATYGNVHSKMFPGGETRGQLIRGDD